MGSQTVTSGDVGSGGAFHSSGSQPPPSPGPWQADEPSLQGVTVGFGFDNPPDYNDNQGFCGGAAHQHLEMGGKCGICGDPYDGPWPHEVGGEYANGHIVAEYKQGQEV